MVYVWHRRQFKNTHNQIIRRIAFVLAGFFGVSIDRELGQFLESRSEASVPAISMHYAHFKILLD
jgi:hypothetical protein